MAEGSGDEAHGGGAPASAGGASPPHSARGSRSRQAAPEAPGEEDTEREGAAPEVAPEEPASGAGCYAAAPAGAGELATTDEDELETWLLNLDQGRGKMVQYLGPLREEFGSLMAVAAAYIPGGNNGPRGLLESVEPLIFDVLQVVSLGHRLLLARGIAELAAGVAEEQAAGTGECDDSAVTQLGGG